MVRNDSFYCCILHWVVAWSGGLWSVVHNPRYAILGDCAQKRGRLMKPILIDCDGVLADFFGACQFLAEDLGIVLCPKEYDFMQSLDSKHKAKLVTEINRQGFCANIWTYDGAIRLVNKLRHLAAARFGTTLVCVTSPWVTGPSWDWERRAWLRDWFRFETEQIIFCKNKWLVNGSILIEDSDTNLAEWLIYTGKPSIRISRPWNDPIGKNDGYDDNRIDKILGTIERYRAQGLLDE